MRKIGLAVILLLPSLCLMANAQRLPDNAAPDGYRITLAPNFEKDNFTGDETIQIRRDSPNGAQTRLHELAPFGFDVVIDATGSPAIIEPIERRFMICVPRA